MAPGSPALTGLDGASIDGSWYRDVIDFAHHTPWLHWPLVNYAQYGIGLFAVLLVVAWWQARRGPAEAMALVLWVPVATVLAYLVNNGFKGVFTEPRPCQAMPGVAILVPCDSPTDWSFPSNHSAIAAGAGIAILLVSRRLGQRPLGVIAVLAALLMGFCRVYVGAHYPHDVLVGLALGAVVGLSGLLVLRWLTPLVTRLRAGSLGWLVGPPSALVG